MAEPPFSHYNRERMHKPAPIVFIHGLIGTLQEPDLPGSFEPGRALAPDLLGYGSLSGVAPAEVSLPAQVAHLRETIERSFGAEPVHLVGHSIGGALAGLFAHEFAERVSALVSVEGNFTLKDAFWSSAVAKMTPEEAGRMLDGFRQDPGAWLARSGIAPQPHDVEIANRWLSRQPASTIRAMARSAVAETGSPDYLPKLRAVFSRHRVHLIAGARSRPGWDAPGWALSEAASLTVIPGAGHMMMLENPAGFAAAVKTTL